MEVKMTEDAMKDFKKLDTPVQVAASDEMEKLKKYPEVSGVKNLEATWKGYARVKVLKDWRLLFRPFPGLLVVVRIRHRSKAYD
jgi:mRNA-degrading endonuclease RelE of RelBE toxin-antitoxin system